MELDIELRNLTPGVVLDLCQILETGGSWKQLMSVIPSSINNDNPKYTVEHMKLIEFASEKQKRHCTEILFDEWGTSGQKRPHLSDLLKYLVKAELFRAAEYVSTQLLKQQVPSRPSFGPAAPVIIPDVLHEPSAPPISDWGSVCLKQTKPITQKSNVTVECSLKHLSYQLLSSGTNNFCEARKLGAGGFGSVFLCVLDGVKTAVKRLQDSELAIPGFNEIQFKNEVLLLGRVSHPNLLSLLAYSTDGPFLCLVYEFMHNGSLQDALACTMNKEILEWKERLAIALGTAKALDFIHTMEEKPLIHRDVKSANILLDENLNPKVGDFGLARQGPPGKSVVMHTSTIVGTSAYMAPEVFKGDVSPKGDIFSFGVVLLEIITGLPPYDENRDGYDLASHVDEIDNFELLVDKRPTGSSRFIAIRLYDIAQKCLLEKKSSRPNATTVVKLLEEIDSSF